LSAKKIRYTLLPYRFRTDSEKYFSDDGNDLLHAVNLTSKDLCLDIGAYLGEYSDRLFNRYGCQIALFEPVKSFFDVSEAKFKGNDFISLFNYGLGAHQSMETFGLSGAASGHLANADQEILVCIQPASILNEIFSASQRFRLVKINIEGGEFELIPSLSEYGILPRVDSLLIQFHEINGYEPSIIREILDRTHFLVWQYAYVWERWDIRETALTSTISGNRGTVNVAH
jgi:FkbM family methyltransferase